MGRLPFGASIVDGGGPFLRVIIIKKERPDLHPVGFDAILLKQLPDAFGVHLGGDEDAPMACLVAIQVTAAAADGGGAVPGLGCLSELLAPCGEVDLCSDQPVLDLVCDPGPLAFRVVDT